MRSAVDLDRYPLDRPDTDEGQALVRRCRTALADEGMFSLDGFLRPAMIGRLIAAISPAMARDSFRHARRHNIYFLPEIAGVPAGHPALAACETINHTLCADQIAGSPLIKLYGWPPLIRFLAEVMGKRELHTMADPLARVNVMEYRNGEALNWHFDRSEFTTTLLLQAPEAGGAFQYRRDLRSDEDPNVDGVARLLAGQDPEVRTLAFAPGTLNVFRGKHTAHRVTPVEGRRTRMIAVFSYFDRPGVVFTEAERVGFYGRAG